MADLSEYHTKLLNPKFYTSLGYRDAFKHLRDEDPVHWVEDSDYGKDYWTVTRYDDVKEYLESPDKLSSRWDTRVPRSPKRRTPEERHAQGIDIEISRSDNPWHDVYRRPMNKHFSVPAIAKLGHDIDAIIDEIIDDVAERGEADLVEDIAGRLPILVVLRMLGVPEEDWDLITLASWQWFASADPRYIIDGDEMKTHLHGLNTVMTYCAALAANRRKKPQDDFATVIANMEVDGDPLSTHEMKTWFATIIAGGLETTRNSASVGTWLFLNNPDQRRLLLENPRSAKGAVEEVFRWATPAKNRLRIANYDFEWHDKKIKTGDWVVAWLASANMDERQFEDPNRFDITRSPNEHLSLGSGVHTCLGRNLARLELGTFFPKLLSTFPDLEVVENENPSWIADRSVTGFTEMKVRFTPVARGTSRRGVA